MVYLVHFFCTVYIRQPQKQTLNEIDVWILQNACKDCDQINIGQTKRSIDTRYKEHAAYFLFGKVEFFSVEKFLIKLL